MFPVLTSDLMAGDFALFVSTVNGKAGQRSILQQRS